MSPVLKLSILGLESGDMRRAVIRARHSTSAEARTDYRQGLPPADDYGGSKKQYVELRQPRIMSKPPLLPQFLSTFLLLITSQQTLHEY